MSCLEVFNRFVGMVLNCGPFFWRRLGASFSFGIELVSIKTSFQKPFTRLHFSQNQELPKVADSVLRLLRLT